MGEPSRGIDHPDNQAFLARLAAKLQPGDLDAATDAVRSMPYDGIPLPCPLPTAAVIYGRPFFNPCCPPRDARGRHRAMFIQPGGPTVSRWLSPAVFRAVHRCPAVDVVA